MENNQAGYYSSLFQCSSNALLATDCAGHITDCNRSAEQLFGMEEAQILGQHIDCLVPEHYQKMMHQAIADARAKGQPCKFEVEQRREEGTPKTMVISVIPVFNAEKLLGLAVAAHDITERKKLEGQLVQAEKMASLGTLAAGVAHHFNNIIGGVATYVDYALDSHDPQASQRALQMTAEAASRIGQITESLLTFAEKDIRQFDLSDLTEVVLTFSHLVEKPLGEKNIRLQLHLQAVPVLEVPGSRIHQALGNLLDNAECAMPEGGTVMIGLECQDNAVVLEVSDTGCGIAPKDLPHIFEPFFTTRGVCSGGNQPCAGLGLAVVHGIVKELGGSIEVQSELGEGTTFYLRFPLRKKK